MEKIKENFKNPGSEFRSAPFWSWNDKLEVKELCKQLDDMKAGGFGGAFMHSRTGLVTKYLSQEWMNCIRETVEYSKKTGLLAYLYDEDRWPSGFAGGLATKNKKNWIKGMAGKKTNGKWRFTKLTQPANEWFNNAPYLATINKNAVRDFIDSTYEAYKNVVGSEFGKTVPGIFTDEPDYMDPWFWPKDSVVVPWTDDFGDIFKKKYGYDLIKNMALLVENTGNYEKVRYDYWKLAGEMLLENYGRQIYDWCDKNNIAYTGHYNGEDSLHQQMRSLGAAMPLYEYMHIPGIDHLTKKFDWHLLTAKQCSSVANQLGKKRVLSEIYGASGQDLSFTERKQVGDWDIALGINLFCPHLWLYSMRGCRKRDFPPTISYQQPYWKYNKPLEDHFARLSYITSQGKFKPDLLVIHPIESAWILHNPQGRKDKCNIAEDRMTGICKNILSNHYDFDFGDESLLAKYGKVEKIDGRAYFVVGDMKYPFLLLPPMLSIRRSTLALLGEFIKAGGMVLSAGEMPAIVEGERNRGELGLLNGIETCSVKDVVNILEKNIPRVISVTGKDGKEIPEIYCQKRVFDDGKSVYLLANTNIEKSFQATIRIKGTVNLEYWDTFTGQMYSLPASQEQGFARTEVFLPAAGSLLLVQGNGDSGLKQINFSKKQELSSVEFPDGWNFERIDKNSITLDMCRYKLGNSSKWSNPLPVISLQSELEKKNKEQKVALQFRFDANFGKKPDELFLALEQPEIFGIKVNGKPMNYTDTGWWVDTSFRKIDILEYAVLKDRNLIELTCMFRPPKKAKTLIFKKNGVELESVYIAGDFAVRGKIKKTKNGFTGEKFVLENENDKIRQDSLVSNGYPFFAGSVVFRKEIKLDKKIGENTFLKFDDFKAMVAKIKVNDKEAGLVFLPPYELDLTEYLNNGKNSIEIELSNTLRNLLGPHHLKDVNPRWVGPEQFAKQKGSWTDKYIFVPFGVGKINLIGKK